MRPPSHLRVRWLYLLVGALACALRPASGWVSRPHWELCDFIQMMEAEHQQCLEEAEAENDTAGCSKMWDNITCWPATPRGQVAVLACPFSYDSPLQGRNVSRSCTDEGWAHLEPGPYDVVCALDDKEWSLDEQQLFYSSIKTGYTIGHSLSLATLLIATAILSLFRKLHCTRNYIHLHLFLSFILRAVSVLVKDLTLFDSGHSDSCPVAPVGCKAVVVLFQYCVMANYFWLLVEGLYLYTLLAVSFFSERKYFWGYILIGWGVPSIFIMAWTITKIHFEDYGCWDTIDSSLLWWILKAPILTSILVNFIMFVLIIRILVQKLQPPDVRKSEKSPYSRLAKSTLLLIPLFGVHYTMFAFFPDNFKSEVKLVFELVVGSFQGFVVAVLYCFLNGEQTGVPWESEKCPFSGCCVQREWGPMGPPSEGRVPAQPWLQSPEARLDELSAGRASAEVAALELTGHLGLGPQIPVPPRRRQRGHVQHPSLLADPRQPQRAPLLQLPGGGLPSLTARLPGAQGGPARPHLPTRGGTLGTEAYRGKASPSPGLRGCPGSQVTVQKPLENAALAPASGDYGA
ncbi:vasoactive intestinal polypeptide receptor 1 isoform X5 [Phyllostomus hastatus]|uniref:vasoactive intestinal polypeptide receptor 1 isoform X5 n=1 Tax=Phyllostomus hastatus TaxID=9423 RepID=UPI001E68418E|nr:vasoactive intestinal polypeptide receptor 1 isoform X5 [Phyllostomus hastatus]